jgi:hypothetical protein
MLIAAIAAILGITALLLRIGADAQWLAALGRVIVARHGVPAGVPFAAAPSAHWPNALVLAELAFNGLEQGLGDRGLMLAQLLAVTVGLVILARDALNEGADGDGTAIALLVAALGALSSLVIVRVQLFSIALFPLLLLLLRSQARRPSRRIWIVVGILALWTNLHGAVLIGLLLTLAYLLLGRLRKDPVTAVAVGLASVAATFLTPALLRTVDYYDGVLHNQAAQRGIGLWAPLSLSAPLDDVAILAALILAWRARRSRPQLWEIAAALGLALLGVLASRSMVWLLFFLVVPAARTFRPLRTWRHLLVPSVTAALAAVAFAIARGPASSASEDAQISRALGLAHGTPVLASDRLAERIALDGGRIWLGNPLDAFSAHDQSVYLDWSQGNSAGLAALVPEVRVVLLVRDSASERLMSREHRFVVAMSNRATVLYVRAR